MLSRCFLDCSVGVGVFVMGLSQISSFFSYQNLWSDTFRYHCIHVLNHNQFRSSISQMLSDIIQLDHIKYSNPLNQSKHSCTTYFSDFYFYIERNCDALACLHNMLTPANHLVPTNTRLSYILTEKRIGVNN